MSSATDNPKKDSSKEEKPLAEQLHAAAKNVTARIAARNKLLKGGGGKIMRNPQLVRMALGESHQDSIAMVEFATFLDSENLHLRRELRRVTNDSSWLRDEAEPMRKEVEIGEKVIETTTESPMIEKR